MDYKNFYKKSVPKSTKVPFGQFTNAVSFGKIASQCLCGGVNYG